MNSFVPPERLNDSLLSSTSSSYAKESTLLKPHRKPNKTVEVTHGIGDKLLGNSGFLNSHALNKSAYASLSAIDQASFESFVQGPSIELPFSFLHQAFEHWVNIQPNAIAAEFNGQSINYAQLNVKAELLKAKLFEMGVKPNDKVGLFVKRSIDMLVAMLAIFKAGAAYIPLDAGVAPRSQMQTIIDVAEIKLVLTFNAFIDKIPRTHSHTAVLLIDNLNLNEQKTSLEHAHHVLPTTPSDSHCAFVLFTSGTTGVPNGVQVSHKNLCNILLTNPGNMMIKPGDKVSQILNIGFDMSAWEIWGALCNGGHLVIRGKSIEEAVAKADVVIATPSILDRISLESVLPIKAAAVAGEPCPRPLADKWADACAFFNSCGPTETTIINTAQRHFSESTLLSIGSPTPNNTVYVLDKDLKPCAIGDVGEMWAGGDCVSLGYIANQQLTDERYKPDPFLGSNRLMFRTRDLGRWTKDGQLEHLGRTDDQVKVRGFRVELDAVSNLLEQQQHCQRAVTLKLNNRDLIAFVMPELMDTRAAKQSLAKKVPYYSVPAHIIAMPKLPLTDRGKVDKAYLKATYFKQVATLSSINEQLQTPINTQESSPCR
jgi:amino acid adenylation domain-containing protein